MKNNLLREILIMSKPLFYVIFLQALFVSFLHAEESSAQRKSLYEIEMSLEAKNASVIEVFKQIEDKTDFIFTYNDRFIESKKVSINRRNQSLGQILEILSKATDLTFKRINENIHVSHSEGNKLKVTESYAEVTAAISGRVVDGESGEPLPGATVLVKGTSVGTVTDMDGNYTIDAPDDATTLVFSFIGYAPQEIAIEGRSVIDVTMQLDISSLSEVVVTGYASQKKADLTGSVGTVSTEEVTALPTTDVATQLQGRVAGVNIVGSGQPGSTPKVRIRGFGSFANNDPLYVVDGVQTTDISNINPNDIESVSVLKDAGAASIYGSRAANGVVVIETKKGSPGVQVNYNMFTGIQDPGDGFGDLLDATGYMQLQQLVYDNDGINEVHPIYGQSGSLSLPSWGANTNWWDEVTNRAPISQHNLSLSGGNEDAKFFGSLQYFDQEGVVVHTGAKRFSARFNSSFNIKDRVTIGQNLTGRFKSQNQIGELTEGNEISSVYRGRAIIPVRVNQTIDGLSGTFEPGDWGGTGLAPRLGNGDNPVANLTRDKDDISNNFNWLGNVYADVKILEGLNFKTSFGGTYNTYYFQDYTFSTYENSENIATPSLGEGAGWSASWNWTNTLTFERQFGVNRILAVAGYEAVESGISRGLDGRRSGYFTDEPWFRTLSNGSTIQNATSFQGTPRTLLSQFLRADYAYNDKYLLSATIRRDGASVFGEDNKYGVFPSVSAGWRIGDEPFLKGNAVVSDLKIRGGYGTMGNQAPVATTTQFALFGGGTGDAFYAIDGATSSSSQGFRPTTIANKDIAWETNITTNIGFDAGFLDNRFELIFDYYIKRNVDLLFRQEFPGTAGSAQAPEKNIGEMKNTGIDLQAIYRDNITSDFSLEANLTFTTYKNEIVSIIEGVEFFDTGGSRFGNLVRNEVGRPLSSYYGYEITGLFQSESEVNSAPAQDGAEAGFFRYADIDGNNEITPEDRTFLGDPNPSFTAGLNLMMRYKDFDLTAFLYTSQGNDIYNYVKWWTDFWPSFQGGKSTRLLNDSWTESRTDTDVPKASNTSNFSTNTQSTSYYIEDGSYVRLKNLQIGYNLPQSVLGSIGIGSARIYLQGSNLFTITKYSGLDPELGGGDQSFGIDYGNYPNVKQYLIGVNIGF